jgi:hypothetical protein
VPRAPRTHKSEDRPDERLVFCKEECVKFAFIELLRYLHDRLVPPSVESTCTRATRFLDIVSWERFAAMSPGAYVMQYRRPPRESAAKRSRAEYATSRRPVQPNLAITGA